LNGLHKVNELAIQFISVDAVIRVGPMGQGPAGPR